MPQWNRVRDFAQLRDEFFERAHRIVWCNVATVSAAGRPTSRLLHAIWEPGRDGLPIGWIATRRTSPKASDIAVNPFVSLAYVADIAAPLYVECEADWADTLEHKQHLWDLFKHASPPLGYDPEPIFRSVVDSDFGALRLTPWRIQLFDPNGTRRTWLRD